MTKKSGGLRIRKAATVYGPMNRDDLDRLLAARKVTLDDQVSVGDCEWTTLGDYLAATRRQPPSPARSAVPVAAAAPSADGDAVLRLLTNKRIVAALSRAEVMHLRQSSRIGDDDLVCALHGPWMRVGDFLATPYAASACTLSFPAPASSGASTLPVDHEPPQAAPRPIAPVVLPGPASAAAGPSSATAALLAQASTDQWYVRVRGIHSAPLGKHHVRALFDAHEITRDCIARHAGWPDDTWLPIREIPQLAEAVK